MKCWSGAALFPEGVVQGSRLFGDDVTVDRLPTSDGRVLIVDPPLVVRVTWGDGVWLADDDAGFVAEYGETSTEAEANWMAHFAALGDDLAALPDARLHPTGLALARRWRDRCRIEPS